MKKIFLFALVFMLSLCSITAAADTSDATYTVVSAVIDRDYDFYVDFAPWVHDDMTPGDTFVLADERPDVTLTLKNNLTGETVEYESRGKTGFYVEAETATLLYETATLPATLTVSDVSGYTVQNTTLPVTITVTSSPESALRQKYFDVTRGLSADMTEGVDFTVDADPAPDAAITILRAPASFHLDLYNFETGETVAYYGDDAHLTFADTAEIGYFSQSDDTFYFDLPATLVLDDGYELTFNLRVHAHPAGAANTTTTTTADTAGTDPIRSVETGDPASGVAGICLLAAGAVLIALRRRSLQKAR